MDSFETLDPHYAWIAVGLILAAAEMAIPGVFLIWMAGAALIVGFVTWFLPIGVPLQIVMFAALAIVFVFAGKRYLRNNPIEEVDPMMNQRGTRLVGETAKVVEAIEHGSGRVHIGDSEWIARGSDVAVGESVRVVGSEGTILLVEKLA